MKNNKKDLSQGNITLQMVCGCFKIKYINRVFKGEMKMVDFIADFIAGIIELLIERWVNKLKKTKKHRKKK